MRLSGRAREERSRIDGDIVRGALWIRRFAVRYGVRDGRGERGDSKRYQTTRGAAAEKIRPRTMANRGTELCGRGTDDVERRENVDKGADMFRIADERFKNEDGVRARRRADSNARLAGRVGRVARRIVNTDSRKKRRESRERSSQVHVYALRRFRGTAVTETRPRVIPGFVRVVTNRR